MKLTWTVGTLAIGTAWMLPFFPGEHVLQWIALLFVAGAYAVLAGLPQNASFCRLVWAGLAALSLCVLLTSIVLFFIYFFDPPPNPMVALFSFQTRGITDAVTLIIIFLAFDRSDADARDYDDRKEYDERLALMRGQYKLFIEGDEEDIPPVDPTHFGYGKIMNETCYLGIRGVTLGKFVEWTQEIHKEIAGKLKVAVAEGSATFGEKTSRVVREFVQQGSGVILVFKHHIVFFEVGSFKEIVASDITRVLWASEYVILVCRNNENPIVFRVPPPTFPWVLAAAIMRSVRVSGIELLQEDP